MSAILARLDWRTRVRMERVCKRWQRLALKLWTSEEDIAFALNSFTSTKREFINYYNLLFLFFNLISLCVRLFAQFIILLIVLFVL